MRSFNYNLLNQKTWDAETLSLVAAIYKYAGREEFYFEQNPRDLDKLIDLAKVLSTETSNEIEGIITTSTRLKQLVENKITPKSRNEQEIAGYRDVLNLIHESYDAIPLTRNYILEMHKILFSHANNPLAGKTKNVQNYISATYKNGVTKILVTPPAPYETPEMLDKICEEYNLSIGNNAVEPLIAIPVFIHDFLCIHPFNDGNGRLSRLLTTLLLYRSGFSIGKYISLESKIAATKDVYYQALHDSQSGWDDEKEDVGPFLKYLLGTILSAYKDLDTRIYIVEPKSSAYEMVKSAVQTKLGKFTKSDIESLCPTLSQSSVEGALRKLVEEGIITRFGIGKSTYYTHSS